MPNIKSAKKRVKQDAKRHEQNLARKTAIKTAIKKMLSALEANEIDQAKTLLSDVEAKMARARSKGVLHGNTVSRKMSRLAKKVAQAARPA